MKSRIAALGICACLVLALAGCAKAPLKGPQRLKVGDPAPSFMLSGIWDNEAVDAGRIFQGNSATVVILWSMACPTCREALIACEQVYEQYGNKAMAFVGVNFDQENIQGVRTFLKGENIKFTNVWDPGARVTRTYRASDYTFSVFVADRAGKLVLAQYDHPPDLAEMLSKTLDSMVGK